MTGTRLEASAALELQDLMATEATSSGNKLSSSRIVYLQQLAGERFQKGVCLGHLKAASDPSFLLSTSLTTLRKGHEFGNGALNSLHPYRAQGGLERRAWGDS